MDDATHLAPIAGVTLEQFAHIAKAIATQRLDADGAGRYALTRGISPAEWDLAAQGWDARLHDDAVLAGLFGRIYEKA